MSLTAGIVGLPNVGKSTLFNAITKKNILAANYPFATIDPNVGVVVVPDKRIDTLNDLYIPERLIPTTYEFTDIAGLVKGASKGEGLGNKFLSHIREVDAIVEVVRCFDDGKIITGTRITGGISYGEKKSIDLTYDDISEKGGERVGSPASPTDNALSMLNYPETARSTNVEIGWFSSNDDGDVLLGPKTKSKHIIFGGFYSVKFNLTEFLERIGA